MRYKDRGIVQGEIIANQIEGSKECDRKKTVVYRPHTKIYRLVAIVAVILLLLLAIACLVMQRQVVVVVGASQTGTSHEAAFSHRGLRAGSTRKVCISANSRGREVMLWQRSKTAVIRASLGGSIATKVVVTVTAARVEGGSIRRTATKICGAGLNIFGAGLPVDGLQTLIKPLGTAELPFPEDGPK